MVDETNLKALNHVTFIGIYSLHRIFLEYLQKSLESRFDFSSNQLILKSFWQDK